MINTGKWRDETKLAGNFTPLLGKQKSVVFKKLPFEKRDECIRHILLHELDINILLLFQLTYLKRHFPFK